MKLSKIICALAIAILVVGCFATSANAFSNEDLKNYLTGNHTIGGKTYKLSAEDITNVVNRLNSNPVSDAEADSIRAQVEAAKKEAEADMQAQGVSSIYALSAESKAKGSSKLKSAAAVAGVNVTTNKDGGYTATDAKTGKVIAQNTNAKASLQEVTTGNAGSGAASTSASNGGSTTSTVQTFAKTGSDVSAYVGVALIAVIAVSAYFVKKVNEK